MPTWTELREHLQKHLTLAVDQPEWVGLNWKFQSSVEGKPDVVQRQRIELAQANGEAAVLVLSDIVDVTRLPAEQMLTRNMTLGVGAVAILENDYVMRHIQPLESIVLETFEKTLTYIAHEAARLRETAPGAAAPTP